MSYLDALYIFDIEKFLAYFWLISLFINPYDWVIHYTDVN